MVVLSFIICHLSFSPAGAQSWVKKTRKSTFVLKTFSADGTLLASAAGVFIGEKGEAISSFAPFKGASSATVIDASGKQYAVDMLLGANETYDVAKFRVGVKKSVPAVISGVNAAVGDEVVLLSATGSTTGTIRKTETFGSAGYAYYTALLPLPEGGVGLPLFNAGGQLIGLMQQPLNAADTLNYAVSAVFADSLRIGGLSINDAAMRSTKIRKALPDDVGQALLTLYIAPSALDSAECGQLIDDFIQKFPAEQDGYITRAQIEAGSDHYADADADMQKALTVGTKQDETHYSYSKLIYQKVVYRPEPPYEPWTLDKALSEAQAAYDASPQPIYRQQQAYVLFAQKRYADASDVYATLFDSPLRSPDLFVEASTCRLALADTTAYLALLDSAVSLFSKPYLKEASPYILTRAQARIEAGRYRDAVTDLNDYEQLMRTQVNDNFYYLRFQAEQNGRIYQPALNDIATAIRMNPRQEVYYAEKASLEVRVGLYDDAIATSRQLIGMVPDYSDGHLFLGLALCLKGDKAAGVKSLLRAKELGDAQADGLIEKYGK